MVGQPHGHEYGQWLWQWPWHRKWPWHSVVDGEEDTELMPWYQFGINLLPWQWHQFDAKLLPWHQLKAKLQLPWLRNLTWCRVELIYSWILRISFSRIVTLEFPRAINYYTFSLIQSLFNLHYISWNKWIFRPNSTKPKKNWRIPTQLDPSPWTTLYSMQPHGL